MKKNHKGTLITIASMAVAVIVAMATIQSTQASIDFWLEKPSCLTSGLNQITVYCHNGGGMDGDFNLVVTFVNATFSKQTDMPYKMLDSSTVSLKFVLHKGDSSQKLIYFEPVNEISVFSISVSLQATSLIQFLKSNQLYPTQLSYHWNETAQAYNCTDTQ